MPFQEPNPISNLKSLDYARPQPRTDPVWIIAIVFAVLGIIVPFLCVVGLILSIVAIRRAERFGGSSRKRAEVAQLVCAFGFVSTCLFSGWFYNEVRQGRRALGRVVCAANMKQIGQAFLLYSNGNGNLYPPDLAKALATQDLVPDVFICPLSGSERTTTPFASDPAARAAGNLDYSYTGEGLKNDVRAEEPLLFERLSDHDQDGGNVFFADGHVEFLSRDAILKCLEPLRGTPRLTDEEYNAIIAN